MVSTGAVDMQSSGQTVTTNKPTPNFFSVQMPFLSPNQQCQSTESTCIYPVSKKKADPGIFWNNFTKTDWLSVTFWQRGTLLDVDMWTHASSQGPVSILVTGVSPLPAPGSEIAYCQICGSQTLSLANFVNY